MFKPYYPYQNHIILLYHYIFMEEEMGKKKKKKSPEITHESTYEISLQ